MRRATVFPVLTFLMVSCGGQNEVKTISVLVKQHAFAGSNWISAQGRWKKQAGTFSRTPSLNSVQIMCDLGAGVCREVRAVLTSRADEDFRPPQFMFALTDDYNVLSFSDGVLRARSETDAFDIDLTIWLKEKLVEKNWRETRTRGNLTADPNNWLMERLN